MLDVFETIKELSKAIRRQGEVRKKFSVFLEENFGTQKKNYAKLALVDQLLFEKNIIVYTHHKNVREGKQDWHWSDLRHNGVYVTFLLRKKTTFHSIPRYNVIKMHTTNEAAPSIGLFDRFATKSERLLICSPYVDEPMAEHIKGLAVKYQLHVRFLADVNFNHSPYAKTIIREHINKSGRLRTCASFSNSGEALHTCRYIFYLKDGSVTVFTTGAPFLSKYWQEYNVSLPVTIQSGSLEEAQMQVQVHAAETLWTQTDTLHIAPGLRPMDKVNHGLFGNGQVFTIQGDAAQVVFGNEVKLVKLADLEKLVDPLQLLQEGQKGSRDTLHRVKAKFLAHYLYSQNSITNEFNDFRIKPVPHQLLALKKAITSNRGGNLLFADDVGLGKTIEAGLVIQNVIKRVGDDKARVLIMVPAGLKWQWYEEMREKFGLDFKIWKVHTTGGAEAFGSGTHGEKRMIASYHAMVVGDMEEAILKAMDFYDLVVVDECHRFSNDVTQGWKMLRDVRANNRIGQILMLSATPHNGDRYRFLNLMHLLDPGIFPKGSELQESLKKVTQEKEITPYIYRNDKLGVSGFDGKPLFRNVITRSVKVCLTQEEEAFCEMVIEYVGELYQAQRKAAKKEKAQIGFVAGVYRKMLASSWKNVFRSLQARYRYLLNEAMVEEGLLPVFDEEDIKETDEREERKIMALIKEMKSDKFFKEEVEVLQKLVAAGRQLETAEVDTKIQQLLALLRSPTLKSKKVVIFTQFVKTLEVLKSALGGAGKVAEIQGSINIDDRKKQVDKFKNKVRFLLSTEAGGEGINLQFASVVINFDMPWNPARLQQRVGRVWRYGQEEDVYCYNFFVENSTSDQRILQTLNEKLGEMVRNFLFNVEFNQVRAELREALIYETTMRVLGEVQDDKDFNFENIIGEHEEEIRKERMQAMMSRVQEALEFVVKDERQLAKSTGIRLQELEGFYAPTGVNYLYQFARSVAQAFDGELQEVSPGEYEFKDLNLKELGVTDDIYAGKVYRFQQTETNKTNPIRFFGFGDEFFNLVIDYCRNQVFGGLAGFASKVPALGNGKQAFVLLSSMATSVITGSEKSESYPVLWVVSLPSLQEVKIEDICSSEWEEGDASPVSLSQTGLGEYVQGVVETKKSSLKSLRHKEFHIADPIIESAIGNV